MGLLGFYTGGGAGIRTLGGVTPTTVFETVPFNRSGTPPLMRSYSYLARSEKARSGLGLGAEEKPWKRKAKTGNYGVWLQGGAHKDFGQALFRKNIATSGQGGHSSSPFPLIIGNPLILINKKCRRRAGAIKARACSKSSRLAQKAKISFHVLKPPNKSSFGLRAATSWISYTNQAVQGF